MLVTEQPSPRRCRSGSLAFDSQPDRLAARVRSCGPRCARACRGRRAARPTIAGRGRRRRRTAWPPASPRRRASSGSWPNGEALRRGCGGCRSRRLERPCCSTPARRKPARTCTSPSSTSMWERAICNSARTPSCGSGPSGCSPSTGRARSPSTTPARPSRSRSRAGPPASARTSRVARSPGRAAPPPTRGYASFRRYMDVVFAWAGTYSLARELKSAALADIAAGDVFIKGGFPGHAVLVADVVENADDRREALSAAAELHAGAGHPRAQEPGRRRRLALVPAHLRRPARHAGMDLSARQPAPLAVTSSRWHR